MKIEQFLCDVRTCENGRAGDKSLSIYLDSTLNASASDNSLDHWHACFDLCAEHLFVFTQATLDNFFKKNGHKNVVAKILNESDIRWERR